MPGGGGRPPNRQQIRARQAVLALGAILMLVLIVVAFRGCLNARKDRSFQNYVSDLSSITTETKQLSDGFFTVLSNAGSGASSDIGLSAEINGDTGASQGLLDRADGLDAPGEVSAAQTQIVLSFELRHDAIEGIAAQVDKLGGDQATEATDVIYTQMKVLSASDILYARARDQIEQALTDQGVVVADGVPVSQFLPDPGGGEPDYLDPDAVASAFAGAAGSSSTVSNADCEKDGDTHGLGLVDGGTTLQPSGTALTNGGAVTAPAGDDSIDVAVQNQGSADESGIDVNVTSEDGSIDSTETISTIAASATETASIPLQPAPKAGDSLTLNVDVTPVGCEQVETNNTATFPITF